MVSYVLVVGMICFNIVVAVLLDEFISTVQVTSRVKFGMKTRGNSY